MTQAEFSKLVGRSVFTIQSLESGKHELSEELAIRIAEETGVSLEWLVGGSADSSPVEAVPGDERRRRAYTRTSFERHRGSIQNGVSRLTIGHLPGTLGAEVEAIIASAFKKNREFSALYRIHKFIEELREEFGSEAKTLSALKSLALQAYNLGCLLDPNLERYQVARDAAARILDRKPRRFDEVLPPSGPGVYPFVEAAVAIGQDSLLLRPKIGKR